MPAGEGTTYVGNVSGTNIMSRSSYQLLTSTDRYSKAVQWACFTKTPFLKAIGVEAFGVGAMKDADAFGANQSASGRIVEYETGGIKTGGNVFATTGNSFHTGRLDTYNPELVEGGDEFAYAWHDLNQVQFIPRVDVEDNGGDRLIDIKAQKMDGMKQKFVEDWNYCVLGNSNAPDASTMGPSSVYSDLPNLLSVDQTRTVGGIAKTNSYWQNGYKEVATIGGGGEMDRPITLRRKMEKGLMDRMQYGESTMDYLLVCTEGAYLYYGRLMYADSVQSGNRGAFGTVAKYDAAGVPNYAFLGQPMVWDPAVTVPYAASAVTAGTEAIYGIHVPSFFVSIRTEANFAWSGWEEPREHDAQKTLVASLRTRYTPGVRAMRPHVVFYNIPANGD